MARNRMIKTEFWDDEKLASISRDARLTYIALWNFSDDYGVVKGNSIWLRSKIFPYDQKLKLETFIKWLIELEKIERIIPFKDNSELYYYIPKFLTHQSINRPSKQRNPEPPDNILECSLNTHGVLMDEKKEKRKEIEKNIYGEFENVKLSGEEFGKLKKRFGKEKALEKIEDLSTYLQSKGKRYKDHYATILAWARKENKDHPQPQMKSNPFKDNQFLKTANHYLTHPGYQEDDFNKHCRAFNRDPGEVRNEIKQLLN